MPAAALVPAGVGLLGSFLGSNSSKNAQKADQSAQSGIDNQLVSIYNSLMGQYNQLNSAINPAQTLGQAKSFYQSEVEGGLDPAVVNSAESQFGLQNQRGLNSMVNQLGPALPNVAGSVRDFEQNEIQGNVGLQQGLAAQNQGVRQQGAAGLAGVADSVLSQGANLAGMVTQGLGSLGQQFGGASMFNAQQASANNPFASLAQFLSTPGIFGNSSNATGGYSGIGGAGSTESTQQIGSTPGYGQFGYGP